MASHQPNAQAPAPHAEEARLLKVKPPSDAGLAAETSPLSIAAAAAPAAPAVDRAHRHRHSCCPTQAAVTSLDKKLRAAQDTVTQLQQEAARLRQEAADLPALRGRLAEQLAARGQAEEAAEQLRRQLAQAQAAAEEAQRQRGAARAAAQEAAADAEAQRAAMAEWRADGEAAALQAARASGRAELLEAQVQQLEAANGGLRMDNQAHAARLKAAYERWVGWLAECGSAGGGLVPTEQATTARATHTIHLTRTNSCPNAARASCWRRWRSCRPACGRRAGSSRPRRCRRPQPASRRRSRRPGLPARQARPAWSRRSTMCLWRRRGS